MIYDFDCETWCDPSIAITSTGDQRMRKQKHKQQMMFFKQSMHVAPKSCIKMSHWIQFTFTVLILGLLKSWKLSLLMVSFKSMNDLFWCDHTLYLSHFFSTMVSFNCERCNRFRNVVGWVRVKFIQWNSTSTILLLTILMNLEFDWLKKSIQWKSSSNLYA